MNDIPDHIILGDGVFSINGTPIALNRGGGKWSLEREYKQIEADGDYGPVKGRIRVKQSVGKLELNALEIIPANMLKFYPALNYNNSDPTKEIVTGTLNILDSDYNTVTWTGTTKSGKPVIITLLNAINLEKIDWTIKDKDEIVPQITYTATYDEDSRKTEPWEIDFYTAASGAEVPVATLAAPKAGTKTSLVMSFNKQLDASAYVISDIANLLSALTNDSVAISVATIANSIIWYNTDTNNPMAVITIPSTTFVTGKLIRANIKANTIKDLAGNYILQTTNIDAIVE